MHRSALALLPRGAVAASMVFRAPPPPAKEHTTVTESPQNFTMKPMQTQRRSSHHYEASTKGAEVGARNEAAYMNYEAFAPRDLKGTFAMPHLVNILTVTPIYCTIICIASAGWGIFYWDMYCRRRYEVVLIARPEAL